MEEILTGDFNPRSWGKVHPQESRRDGKNTIRPDFARISPQKKSIFHLSLDRLFPIRNCIIKGSAVPLAL
ncbi:hypothetical protein SAMN05444412_1522 [Rhodonellum ikkaensis]|uniref:Uncharacterized protein n=1 Tax=Rhodonellum ikkaensis TaxID=336829 RepID=A0A1H3UBX0_9BACT|nr:hypothetical protein SAMN05444412_1522 [Rhodonellum ikkaensis]